MNEIIVSGKQEFLGKQVPIIKGGFGENEKCVLASTIAEIHNTELRKVNELINNNIEEFDEDIDIIDMKKTKDFEVLAKDLGFIKSNNQKYCYLLSEQGYVALVGLMRTDKAREIRKDFRRNYFKMQEHIENISSTNNKLAEQSNKLLNKIDNKLEGLNEFYKTTHAKKLDFNRYIKNCLGVNASRENADRVKEILLTRLGSYKTYESIPKDILHDADTTKLIYEICKDINNQFGQVQESMF